MTYFSSECDKYWRFFGVENCEYLESTGEMSLKWDWMFHSIGPNTFFFRGRYFACKTQSKAKQTSLFDPFFSKANQGKAKLKTKQSKPNFSEKFSSSKIRKFTIHGLRTSEIGVHKQYDWRWRTFALRGTFWLFPLPKLKIFWKIPRNGSIHEKKSPDKSKAR